MIRVGIIGGSGYAGLELVRILARHPRAELGAITSREFDGAEVVDCFPHLRGYTALKFANPDNVSATNCDLFFVSTPSGISMNYVPGLLHAGVKVIDLGPDFRLKSTDEWRKWYGTEHKAPDLLKKAVYGLPEYNRDKIKDASLVANPGCYATAVQLGFLPLLEANLVDIGDLVADAKSGVSGAGRVSEIPIIFSEASDNFKAYGVFGHRHLPEIKQGLDEATSQQIGLTFVPHLTPLIRGIHATLYAKAVSDADLQVVFEKRFANESFVDVLPNGQFPDTRSVRGTNVCRIGICRLGNSDRVIILSVIDNLVKGAAGQAIQNMNLMFGFSETDGLEQVAICP